MMYSIYLLLATLFCSTALAKSLQSSHYKDCGAGPNYKLRSKRIASGKNAVENSWPSMVQLKITSPYQPIKGEITYELCGGTLLDKYHILTAAHCIEETHGQPQITAYLGMHDDPGKKGVVTVNISQYVRYEYDDDKKIDDMAVLRMPTPVKFSETISPVCLPQGDDIDNDFFDETVTVLGWGDTGEGETSSVLKEANLQITSEKLCKERLLKEDQYFPKNRMLCAISPNRKNKFLEGDSGGPMFYQRSKGSPWIQIGIISYMTYDEDKLKNPTKYSYGAVVTRVAHYLDNIKEFIRDLKEGK